MNHFVIKDLVAIRRMDTMKLRLRPKQSTFLVEEQRRQDWLRHLEMLERLQNESTHALIRIAGSMDALRLEHNKKD